MNPRRRPTIPAFLADETGSGAAEFALIAGLFIGMMLGVIDMSRLAWEINSAKAAAREGARFAAVSPMASTYLQTYDAVAAGAVPGNGETVPEGAVANFTCSGVTNTCVPDSGSGSNAMDAAAFANIVAAMNQVYGRIAAQNVVVEYRHVGIGFAGNPYAPDVEPLITVSITGLTFDPASLAIFGITNLDIPNVATTISGEDLA